MTAQMKQESGYSIESKAERFIVWRITTDGNKLRQGSFDNEEDAMAKIEDSKKLLSIS